MYIHVCMHLYRHKVRYMFYSETDKFMQFSADDVTHVCKGSFPGNSTLMASISGLVN